MMRARSTSTLLTQRCAVVIDFFHIGDEFVGFALNFKLALPRNARSFSSLAMNNLGLPLFARAVRILVVDEFLEQVCMYISPPVLGVSFQLPSQVEIALVRVIGENRGRCRCPGWIPGSEFDNRWCVLISTESNAPVSRLLCGSLSLVIP